MGRSGIVPTQLAQNRKERMAQWVDQINDGAITWGISSYKEPTFHPSEYQSIHNLPIEGLTKAIPVVRVARVAPQHEGRRFR